MSNFTCVEPNAIEQEETIWLTGIRFNTYVVPKLYDLKLYKTDFSMRKGEVYCGFLVLTCQRSKPMAPISSYL